MRLRFFANIMTLAILFAMPIGAWAQAAESLIFDFTGGPVGASPTYPLVFDAAGNLYGTTALGGQGYGTAFELTSLGGVWAPSKIYMFSAGQASSGLVLDSKGNAYGTIREVGTDSIYRLTPNSNGGWTKTTLYSFNGNVYLGPLTIGPGGLYGTTQIGGIGSGNVFELSPTKSGWKYTDLHDFGSIAGDGVFGQGGLTLHDGILYGTTQSGFSNNNVGGAIFELVKSQTGWTYSLIGGLTGGTDGSGIDSALAFDSSGNLYGQSFTGGDLSCYSSTSGVGCGTLFALHHTAQGWKMAILHRFAGGASDGANPFLGPLFVDSSGNVYGTTSSGGNLAACQQYGCGTVFEWSPRRPNWTILHSFYGGATDGWSPDSGLVSDGFNNLYGTTPLGGAYGQGAAFELTP